MPKKKYVPASSAPKGNILKLWKSNTIVFVSSFCVMVIELVAARILAPYFGVSLYTWTTIIGVILGGIALGNFVGGKIADKQPSPWILIAIFFIGGLLTLAIPSLALAFGNAAWAKNMPILLSFILRTSFIFLLPAFVLSMVSPMVIKLTLADLGATGGVVGTIYALSTVGSIVGTFTTGFLFILLFGIKLLVLLVGGVLILTGIFSLFAWKVPNRWKFNTRNVTTWTATIIVVVIFVASIMPPKQTGFTRAQPFVKESNYYTIGVQTSSENENVQVLSLDHLIHGYVDPNNPLYLQYDYLQIFSDILKYVNPGNNALKVLHLGGGGYSFPRYIEKAYPGSVNDVVEIDPIVTMVAHQKLGLGSDTTVKTYNLDARQYLMERPASEQYDYVIGDVFNDATTPYHLTTIEFDRMVKATMQKDGVYLINTIDDFKGGRYLPSLVNTLGKVFNHVYIFGKSADWQTAGFGTYVIAATDRTIDPSEYQKGVTSSGTTPSGYILNQTSDKYLATRKPVIFTDDYAPTDILLAPLTRLRARN